MNLSQLYYFKKLAELQHYTRAAKELYITQPTLSDSIASLENELGAYLFIKEGRNVRLTKIGIEFYGYVCSALNELDTGIALIKEKTGSLSGSLEIGCIPTLLSDFLPDAIQGYSAERNKNAIINIHTGHSLPIVQKLISDEYDLGFCSKVEGVPEIAFVPIMYQQYILIVRNGHYLSNVFTIPLEDLKPYDILSYRSSIPIGRDIIPYINKHGLNAHMNYDDEISICGIVSTSDSVGIVAETPYLKQFDNLLKIPITGIPEDAHPIFMAYKKRKYISKIAESFADYIVAKKLRL